MTDFLLELRSEEIPARMQAKAREDLARLFAAEIGRAGLAASAIVTYATPRRLALIARDLPVETVAVAEEVKGPKVSAPPQALEGFLRKTGLAREALVERDGVFFAVTERPGRATADVLAEAIPAIVRAFPWPKAMRWGAPSASTESLRWVRPLHGIVAILGDEVVPVAVAGIASGAATLGHRFLHAGAVVVGGAHDYVAALGAGRVIVDQDERAAIIRDGARAAAAAAGLTLVEDEGLVAENAGLTEWPVPLLGRFDTGFLAVPPEVIQLTARVNQKYFVCRDAAGGLADAFVCTANIAAADGGAGIVEGNRKVLAARLADARFFYETDLKVPLADQAAKLDRIVFHEKLGTVADKVERVAKLARWLVEEGIVKPSPLQGRGLGEGESRDGPARPLSPEGERERLADLAERAARLAKADLVTGMVGEFPELQGLMGGYYAAAQGEPPEVAEAVRDHYKPVGQGDDVPTAPVTVAVSLADKLDTLTGFFAIGLLPTGSKDPFALRRQMLALINIVETNCLRLPIHKLTEFARDLVVDSFSRDRWVVDADDDGSEPILLGSRDPGRAGQLLVYAYEAGKVSGWVGDGESISPSLMFAESYDRRRDPPVKIASRGAVADDLKVFMLDRLRVRLREEGVRHDVIDAIIPRPPGEIDLEWLLRDIDDWLDGKERLGVRAYKPSDQILEIVRAARQLDHLIDGSHGIDALHVYRRAAKILAGAVVDRGLVDRIEIGAPEPVMALARWTEDLEGKLKASLALRDLAGALAAIASGRSIIDAFFDQVTVNDADPARRAGRLALLDRVRRAVHGVADFARIEG